MKYKYRIAAILAALVIVFGTAVFADDPPEIEEGWNLVSAPCDVTIEAIEEKTGHSDIQLHRWTGSAYVQVDVMERGVGYVMNSNSPFGASGLCANGGDAEPLKIDLVEGWNLFGNPYQSATAIDEVLGDDAALIADLLFEYKNGEYRPVLKTDKIQPWTALWVYSYADFSVFYDFDCDEVENRLVTDTESEVQIGESLVFEAVCVIDGVEYGITQNVEWQITNDDALMGLNVPGTYIAASPGDCGVSFVFDEDTSNTIDITVLEPEIVLESLVLVSDKKQVYVGESASLTVTGTYSDDSTADLTDEVQFNIDDSDVGYIEGAEFFGKTTGPVVIYASIDAQAMPGTLASVGEIQSNTVVIEVVEEPAELVGVSLEAGETELTQGESTTLTVTGIFSDETTLDMTDQAQFILSEGGQGEVDGNVFNALEPGTVLVHACVGGICSTQVEITITQPQVLEKIELAIAETELMVGDTTEVTVTAVYESGDTEDITLVSEFSYVGVDSTESGSVSIEDGILKAVSKDIVEVTAAYEGMQSNGVVVEIGQAEPEIVSINLTADAYELLVGNSTQLHVYAIYDDGEQVEITDDSELEIVQTDCCKVGGGIIEEGVFKATSVGQVSIIARFNDLSSSTISIQVKSCEPELKYISVKVMPSWIEIHETTMIYAYGHYSDNAMKNISSEVEWVYDESEGNLEDSGKFFPYRVGRIEFQAKYNGLESNVAVLTVTEKKLIWVGIFPEYISLLQPLPCPHDYGYMYCYNNNYINLGDSGKFYAIADYNDGDYNKNVTNSIEVWEIGDSTILRDDGNGRITALKTGTTSVRAYIDGVWSETVWVQVIDTSSDRFLLLEYSNRPSIVRTGSAIALHATYYERIDPDSGVYAPPYSVMGNYVEVPQYTARKVTQVADWSIDDTSIVSFDSDKKLFRGESAGTANVNAEYDGLVSNTLDIEVWDPAEVNYCDTTKPNLADWTDNLTIAQLSTDCDRYSQSDEITVSFSALLKDYLSRGVLDVCLDLFIYDSEGNLVKTFRNSDCTPTPLSRAVQGYTPVYEYTTGWDQVGDDMNLVPPGEYTAVARFYILYCPVLKVKFTIE